MHLVKVAAEQGNKQGRFMIVELGAPSFQNGLSYFDVCKGR